MGQREEQVHLVKEVRLAHLVHQVSKGLRVCVAKM